MGQNNVNIEISALEFEKLISKKMRSCDDEINQESAITVVDNHIYFYVEITPVSILKLSNFMVRLRNEHLSVASSKGKEPEEIHLHINSPGGSASAGFMGYDIIMSIREQVPIFTHIEGLAASAATFLSIAGTKRFITPSSSMIIHELRTIIGGTASEIMEEYQNVIKVQTKIEDIYIRHSNFKRDELKVFLQRDCLLTSTEALERNLVDEIKTVIF